MTKQNIQNESEKILRHQAKVLLRMGVSLKSVLSQVMSADDDLAQEIEESHYKMGDITDEMPCFTDEMPSFNDLCKLRDEANNVLDNIMALAEGHDVICRASDVILSIYNLKLVAEEILCLDKDEE